MGSGGGAHVGDRTLWIKCSIGLQILVGTRARMRDRDQTVKCLGHQDKEFGSHPAGHKKA